MHLDRSDGFDGSDDPETGTGLRRGLPLFVHFRTGPVVTAAHHASGGGQRETKAKTPFVPLPNWMDMPYDQLAPHQQELRGWMESARDCL